jgi:hypothetical protein
MRTFALLALGLAVLPLHAEPASAFLDAENILREALGPDWREAPLSERDAVVVAAAESLPVGGAIHLPESAPVGRLDFRAVADGVRITGGEGGTIVFGGGQHGLRLFHARLNQELLPGVPRPARRMDPLRPDRQFAARGASPADIALFDPTRRPVSGLLALFCEGAIKIETDVVDCAWICGANAFGKRTVTAQARVDRSLFLWFGVNWPFQDYNAHWNPAHREAKWWETHAQMDWDLRGGGEGTRVYEMIETSYGNPGPTVVLKNARGVALYHGSTERGSGQGPGVYWLKDCEQVQLGLRGINAFGGNNGHPNWADANRDITIEGGRGNILHAMRTWSNARDVSLWNSDPELQIWMVGSQYGHHGTEQALQFAVTPYFGRPTPEYLAGLDLPQMARDILALREREMPRKKMTGWPQPHTEAELVAALRTGRFMNAPMNAQDEITFRYAGADLARGERPQARLPAPPTVPPTAAPTTRIPLEFTQQPGFGRALLEAGADPTGQRPSDDAFTQVLYGLSRDALQALLDEAERADQAIWALHHTTHDRTRWDALKDHPDYARHRETLASVMKRIHAARDARKAAAEARVKELKEAVNAARKAKDAGRAGELEAELKVAERSGRGGSVRLEIPAGTFRLERPLYLLGGVSGVWGAGPERTVLKTERPIPVVKLQERCTVANFAVEGGRVGLAMTGHSHHYNHGSPTLKSYIAGENFYRLTFRRQSFAGIHVGNDEIDVMEGAEHDQNKYVDLVFDHTGDYGIYINTSMLDKWLCLNAEFAGQRKAGIAVKFNNLIHGCVIGSRFRNIDGPGVDVFGGNAEIAYPPWEVWIDGCRFEECGNATQPAVEHGIVELGAFTHNTIVTRGKAIAGGYAGAPQICQDNSIDVKLLPGAPAVKLRGVRLIGVSRANGHVFSRVSANGPVVFVNDWHTLDGFFAKTRARLGKAGEPLKWDTNPMAGPLAPANGWVHPYLFHRCTFGEERHAYTLLHADLQTGKVLERVDLSRWE